jgi:hypothetical protein
MNTVTRLAFAGKGLGKQAANMTFKAQNESNNDCEYINPKQDLFDLESTSSNQTSHNNKSSESQSGENGFLEETKKKDLFSLED